MAGAFDWRLLGFLLFVMSVQVSGFLYLHRRLRAAAATLAPRLAPALKWVVGAFLMQERLDILNQFLFLHDYVQDTDSMAVYGELTYPFTDRLRLTVGGRLTEDKKEISMFGIGLGGTFREDGLKIDFNDFTPKVALDYSLSDDALIYASAQEGYKAGAFQGFPQQLTDLTVAVPRTAKSKTVLKAIQKAKLDEQWAATPFAKKQVLRAKRASLTDFDRFKVMLAKKQRRAIVYKEVAALKKKQ